LKERIRWATSSPEEALFRKLDPQPSLLDGVAPDDGVPIGIDGVLRFRRGAALASSAFAAPVTAPA